MIGKWALRVVNALPLPILTLTGHFIDTLNSLTSLLWGPLKYLHRLLWSPVKQKLEEFYPLKARPSTNQQKGINVYT